jgi:hypothetical protein
VRTWSADSPAAPEAVWQLLAAADGPVIALGLRRLARGS